jgi:tetratricopeptide (TPR) repeat protein
VKLTHRAAWGDPDQQAVGFNWRLDKTIDGKRRLSHTGGTFGFAAYSALYPDQNLGIVLLANQSDRTAQGRLVEITDQIVEALYGVPPVLQALRAELAANGYEQAIDVFKRIKKKYPQLHLTQDYVNEWGYTLLGGGQTQQAIGLFKLNVHLYPGSYNTYDSLGEAYERAGNQPLAIQNYKRSLALHPGNANAAARLKDLSADSSRK